ncbi:unnamed protein product [Effrenium voratum]|nr:unnamed protein product [Effrenium voratum]
MGRFEGLGSRPAINFMWVQHDELLAKIKQKGAQQYGLQISASHKKKGGAKPAQHPVQVSPDDLEMIPRSFLADDGSAIEQIAFQRIAKGQAGLAFATVQDITPYLRNGQIVSQGPLAVLTTINIPHEHTGILPVIDLVYPATHRLTKEPVLIKGSLIQLGTVHINREKYKNAPPMITCTLKLTVYRDQLPTQVNWSTFCKGPVKTAMKLQPILNLCHTPGCGDSCPDCGSKTTPEKAQTWSALLQVPSVAHVTLLSSSGSYSLCFDPHEPSGRAPCPNYGVVWLPNTPHSDALRKLKTTDKAISIIRFNDRYGIRFAKDTLAAGHKALRPEEPFNPITVTELCGLHPLPFGVQRQGLAKTLKSWNWSPNPSSFWSRLGSRSSYTTAIQCPSWSAWGRGDHKEIEDQQTHTTWDMDTSDFAMSFGDPRINKLESDVTQQQQEISTLSNTVAIQSNQLSKDMAPGFANLEGRVPKPMRRHHIGTFILMLFNSLITPSHGMLIVRDPVISTTGM